MEQKYSSGVRWLLYIVSFLSLMIGVILGVVLMTQNDEESKEVGKNCLIAAVAGLVFWVVFGILVSVLGLFFMFLLGLGMYAATASSMLLLII